MRCGLRCSAVKAWIRDYDKLQWLAVKLIYAQIASSLIGSLAPLYNGVLLHNLGMSLFALVAIESTNLILASTYGVLLVCSIFLDISWFFLFSHDIWHIPSEFYGTIVRHLLKLTLAMQIIGFSVRLLSSLLWIQIYRLGVSYIDHSGSKDTDAELRNSFLNPATPVTQPPSGCDDVVGGSMYDPASYSPLFEDSRDETYLCGTWTSSDPPKTTVKRILKDDSEKGSANRSLLNKQYVSPQSHEQSTPPSDSNEGLDRSKIGFTKSTTWDQKSTQVVSETPLFDSKILVTLTSSFSSGPNVSEKGLFTKSSQKPSLPNDALSTSTSFQSVFGSSLLSTDNLQALSSFGSKPSSSISFPETPSNSGASLAAKHEVSPPRNSIPAPLNFPPTLPSWSHETNLSSVSPSSSIIKTESLTTLSPTSFAMSHPKIHSFSQAQISVANMPSKTEKDVKIQASASQPGLAVPAPDLKLGPSASSATTELSSNVKSGSQIDLGGSSESSSAVTSVIESEPSPTEALSSVALLSEVIVGSAKNVISDSSHEEEMEEEASETEQTTDLAFGNLGGFGIGSTANSTTPKSNPFGVAGSNKSTSFPTSPYVTTASSGDLFLAASFNFQSPQSPEPLQPTTVSFSGLFSSGIPAQGSGGPGFGLPAFGQPAHIGTGQQALGSVLGSFGESRQLRAGLPVSNAASASGFGGGFMGVSAGGFGGGFASASSGGGFANLATGGGGGGFAAAAGRAGGGFAAAATSRSRFTAAATTGGGFAAAAASAGAGFASSTMAGAISGGGFGAFNKQQGSGGFSAFGGGSGVGRPPSELFTRMRR